MKSEMSHRERILAAINHQPTDRVAMDYWGVGEITQKLMAHFGAKNQYDFAKAMNLDMIMPADATLRPGRANMWNIKFKRIPIFEGAAWYEEPEYHPLAGLETIDEIENGYDWPTTDMYDYSQIKAVCREHHRQGYAIDGGYISLTYFYEMLRGTEQMLLDMALEPELAAFIISKINEFASQHASRILEAADGLVDLSQVTDDFGSQSGLLMSPAMIEDYFGEYYKANIQMVKSFGAHVFHHDDGAIMDIIPWVVDNGCELLNPIQWHLPGWDLQLVKERYGSQLCFHGGIDNQYVLPFGSIDEVRDEVSACLNTLYSDRTGYILAPCHNIPAITPIENVIEMYRFAAEYSKR